MVRTPDLARRRELLDALVRECAESGVGGRSLRELAEAIGTSHRMLLHHFGSRENLLLAVVDDVERQQMTLLQELPPDTGFAAMWAHLRHPELRGLERLFFECYSRGVQGESPFTAMLPSAVDDWLALAQSDPATDPALARLGLSVMRGLLLDLVGTDDEAGVDAAAQRFITLLGARENGSD
ncbi:AcrR family transcriptional regulator [Mycolicibacterium sp. BK556]|uniref:TetR family transcriptional regulator n=1 Tax=unclassified Mycolicibacterium TaxID=2636767 RepID=UPI001615F147|nr:AcrR family transcriptional regulator [Mycolicibacterium sp. BK556]MBB3630472.1 AcrR family transcriptional regulator [Mycolicibacterium sp. BK607]